MAVVVRHTNYPARRWRLEPASLIAAHRRVFARQGIQQLVSIMTSFGTSPAETAKLFHVRRQALNKWMRVGVPQERLADVGRIAQSATALRAFFRAERLPMIVRGPMPALAERTILDTLATDGSDPIFALIDGLRSWTPPSENARELSRH